ncbi:MAG: MBL fold metallo-hydrolase [Bacilli bacterium]|nr:MBL fold metallo-hydrolase [Bacilli bacterium]
MRYCTISSGSKGNSIVCYTEHTTILIDCGITKKKLMAGLTSCGLGLAKIDKLLITHNHSDHISGIKFIPQEKWMVSRDVLSIALEDEQYFEPYVPFQIGDFSIRPIPLSHDAKNTTGFIIKAGGETLVYIADTGFISDKAINLIAGADYYLMESNHDTKMLYSSSRPMYLIRRIHSDRGHLDNIASACYLSLVIRDNTKEVTLVHLSDECNDPECAIETYKKVMIAQLGKIPEAKLRCASVTDMIKGGD